MRFSDMVGEALRNIRTGSSRAGIVASILVLVSTTLFAIDCAAISALQERAATVRSQAGAIRVLVAENLVDPTACSAQDTLHGISDAGPVWKLDPIRLLALPRVEIPLFQLAPGVARMLDFPAVVPGGIYIPDSLAERWHAREGSRLETSTGTLTIDGVYGYSEVDGRDPRLANAIVVIGTSRSNASECWYSVWPPSRSSDQYVYGSVVATGQREAAPQIAPLNPTVGQRFNFTHEYTTRVTALASVAVVMLFGLLALSGVIRRRMELAANLHAGARRRDIVGAIAAETLIWASGAAAATFVFARLSAKILLRNTLAGYETSLSITLAMATVAAVLSSAIPAMLTQENRLFIIFKSRA